MSKENPNPQNNRPYFQKNQHHSRGGNIRIRKNERIRVPKVRVIGPDGAQIGVIPTDEALKKAKSYGLDLVEVSPTAHPPVCKILDFGKFKYDEDKKQKRNKSQTVKQKEIKFRLNIDEHDYQTKLRRAEEFLSKGHKVKLTLSLRGREMEQLSTAFDNFKRFINDLKHIAVPDMEPKRAGRNISANLSPIVGKKIELKYNID